MKVAVVTDSTSDIPTDLVQQYGIQVVPAILVIDGQDVEDGRGISREELYRKLPSMQSSPTTAAPSSGSFERIYEMLFKNGVEYIISIHVSSVLSGIYNAALVAAEAFNERVHIVDSRHVTLGLGYQVLAAAQAASSGLPITEVQRSIEQIRQRIHLVAMLDTLDYVRRSGRISWATSTLSTIFQIKPFVGIQDGKVIRMGETRTRQKGIERLFHMLTERGPLESLAVLHTNAEADAREFAHRASDLVNNYPLIVNVTSIIGVHVGPNALGFVAVTA